MTKATNPHAARKGVLHLPPLAFPMPLSAWAALHHVNRATAYRWRDDGMLKLGLGGKEPMNINGRLYVREDEDALFWDRANRGEFKKELHGIVKTQPKAA